MMRERINQQQQKTKKIKHLLDLFLIEKSHHTWTQLGSILRMITVAGYHEQVRFLVLSLRVEVFFFVQRLGLE